MSNNEELIAHARYLGSLVPTSEAGITFNALTAALEQADRELADDADKIRILLSEISGQAATIEAVKRYADERAWYGQRNRTVGSNRIASDLLAILTSTDTPEGQG